MKLKKPNHHTTNLGGLLPRVAVRPLRLAALFGLLVGSAFPPLASSLAAQPDSYPYEAVTTVGMITDIVRNVAGNKAEVNGLIGEGIDPHLYSPTRNDVVALSQADIIFYNGLMLEGKMGDLFVRMAGRGKPVVAVTSTILDSGDYVMTDEEDHYDPHVWMDVRGWILATEVVAESLSEFDPANADSYRVNADAYIERLEELDAYAAQAIESIPENQRVLVTAHDAFSYMGRAYGIEVKGIQGISTESEAGVRDIENLVNFLVENKIPAVFVESSVSGKNIRAVVEGTQARGWVFRRAGRRFGAGSLRPARVGLWLPDRGV